MKVKAKTVGQYNGRIYERNEVFEVSDKDFSIHPQPGTPSNWWEPVMESKKESPKVEKKTEIKKEV